MVEWPSSGYVRTFDQSAANGRKEPTLPIFYAAARPVIAVIRAERSIFWLRRWSTGETAVQSRCSNIVLQKTVQQTVILENQYVKI